jgi:predicted Zn-dependent protease
MLRGNNAAARRILTNLTREHPEDPRAQQLLAKLQSMEQRRR